MAPDLRGLKVLLVEDCNDTRVLFEVFLCRRGAAVQGFTDAADALVAFEQTCFDAIVSDLSMPGMDGYAFLSAVRRAEERLGRPPTPALAVSANMSRDVLTAALLSGFDEGHAKPISMDKLCSIVARLARSQT